MGIEIERKYLIRVPDLTGLKAEIWDIEQIYLVSEKGETRRLRRIVRDGAETYYFTYKKRINALSCTEIEREITPEEYAALKQEADPARKTLFKTRYRLPHNGHTVEIDLFPFWTDRALCEIELESEGDDCPLPDYVTLIKEVTGDFRYKNTMLAVNPPMEALP